jgi:hypothetical protein
MMTDRVGDGMCRFGLRLFPGHRPHCSHGGRGCPVGFAVAGSKPAHLTVGQTRPAPGWLAVLCPQWRTLQGLVLPHRQGQATQFESQGIEASRARAQRVDQTSTRPVAEPQIVVAVSFLSADRPPIWSRGHHCQAPVDRISRGEKPGYPANAAATPVWTPDQFQARLEHLGAAKLLGLGVSATRLATSDEVVE